MLTHLLDAALAQVQPAADDDGVVRVVSINLLPGKLQLTYENDCGRHESDWFEFARAPDVDAIEVAVAPTD